MCPARDRRFSGIESLPYAWVMEVGLDVDLWRCRTFEERAYAANL